MITSQQFVYIVADAIYTVSDSNKLTGSDCMKLESIGKRIREYRLKNNMRQEDLAEKMDLSVPYISRVERGTTSINLKRLSQMCALLEVSEGEILQGAENTSSSYLESSFSNLLKSCPPEKIDLIYKIAKIIAES